MPSHIHPASPHSHRWLPAVTRHHFKISRRNNPKNSKSNVLQKQKKNLKQKEKKEKRLQADNNLEPAVPLSAASTSHQSSATEASEQHPSLQQQLPINQNHRIVISHPKNQFEKKIPALMDLDLTRIPAKHRLGPAPSSNTSDSSTLTSLSSSHSSSVHAPAYSTRIAKETTSVFKRLEVNSSSATTPEAVHVTKRSVFNRLGNPSLPKPEVNVTQHPLRPVPSLTSSTLESSVTQAATVTSSASSSATLPVLPTAPTTPAAPSIGAEGSSESSGQVSEEVLRLTPDTEDEFILLSPTAPPIKVKSVIVVPSSGRKDLSITRKRRTERASDRAKTPGSKSAAQQREKTTTKKLPSNPYIL